MILLLAVLVGAALVIAVLALVGVLIVHDTNAHMESTR